jgi:small subunit ribosomal protein S21
MIVVKVDKGIENALREYKKKFSGQKVMNQIRDKSEYVKPSIKNRKLKRKAIKRDKWLKDNE